MEKESLFAIPSTTLQMASPIERENIPRNENLANAPKRKRRTFPFSSVVGDPEELAGEARLGTLVVKFEFHFVLGQMKLYVYSWDACESLDDKKIILREKDWCLCKFMINNSVKGKTEQPESVSSLWKSESTDEESVYFRVFCALRKENSSLTFTRQIGEEAGEKVQEMTCPLELWNTLVERQGERIDQLFQRSKMYRSVIKVSRCIFPSEDGTARENEGGGDSTLKGVESLGGANLF